MGIRKLGRRQGGGLCGCCRNLGSGVKGSETRRGQQEWRGEEAPNIRQSSGREKGPDLPGVGEGLALFSFRKMRESESARSNPTTSSLAKVAATWV